MIKDTVNRVLDRFGLRLVRVGNLNTLEAHLVHVFDALDINCVLDVGANDGEYGTGLRRAGFEGDIVSFEPVGTLFDRLQLARRGDPRWTAHRIALGDEDGEAEINVYAGHTFNSFLSANASGAAHFGPKLALERKETVAVRRLDSVIDEVLAGVRAPRVFLKVDTQGYDMTVLRGAGDRLRSVRGMQVEIAVDPIYSGMTTDLAEFVPAVREMGFALTGLFPVTRDAGDGLKIIEMDGVFCR